MTGRQTTDQTTQEQLTAIAAAEMANVEWSSYERMLLQYLRGDILRGDKESAKVFLNDLYVVVCKKRAALVELEAELFTCKKSNKEAKK
jgi:hypothetical protein